MIYIILDAENKAVAVSNERVEGAVVSRWDYKDMAHVERLASELSEATGSLYVATDAGSGVSPRYDVIKAPAVGDAVSYAFNGDYYEDGEIVAVSSSLKVVTTSSGKKYYRKALTGRWLYSKTWTLVQGHRNEQNPHL